jgi:hypothetical protein
VPRQAPTVPRQAPCHFRPRSTSRGLPRTKAACHGAPSATPCSRGRRPWMGRDGAVHGGSRPQMGPPMNRVAHGWGQRPVWEICPDRRPARRDHKPSRERLL